MSIAYDCYKFRIFHPTEQVKMKLLHEVIALLRCYTA